MAQITPTPANGDDELDQLLDAAQQAWEQGETLLLWVERYPAYAQELTELALLLARLAVTPDPPVEEIEAAQRSWRRAMISSLRPGNQPPD